MPKKEQSYYEMHKIFKSKFATSKSAADTLQE